MSKEKKKRLKEYQKNYREAKKTSFTNPDMPIKVHYKISIAKIFFVRLLLMFKR